MKRIIDKFYQERDGSIPEHWVVQTIDLKQSGFIEADYFENENDADTFIEAIERKNKLRFEYNF